MTGRVFLCERVPDGRCKGGREAVSNMDINGI